jgi:hypothetical protein
VNCTLLQQSDVSTNDPHFTEITQRENRRRGREEHLQNDFRETCERYVLETEANGFDFFGS